MDSCHCVSCIKMISTEERINYRHTLEWEACKYQPATAVHCSLLMESLMRSDIQWCCSHGDWAKIKGFMKSLLSKLATEINDCPTWISVRGIWCCLVTYKGKREREWVVVKQCFLYCAPESAIFSLTGFLLIHYIQQLESHCLAQTLHPSCQCCTADGSHLFSYI